jgi:hypothetical protein
MGQAGGLPPAQFRRNASDDFVELGVGAASLEQVKEVLAQGAILGVGHD